MRKALLLLLAMMWFAVSFGQVDAGDKMSVTTHIFLKQLKEGRDKIARKHVKRDRLVLGKDTVRLAPGRELRRVYGSPVSIDGVDYISAFVRLADNAGATPLERKGARVQCKFRNGLVTALIPVDSVEAVARIADVRALSVSRLMRKTTDNARRTTNVDDVLTNSTDAISAGLAKKYDGTGVVLGVIDTGIDFQHIAFKDADGNSRIRRAYVYNGRTAREYTSITATSPTTDDNTEDHGTHTSSIAGGSSVIIDGESVTVTADASKATYGGMAPGAELYLAGINGLEDTYIANAFQKMNDYATAQGKPLVVSNSWGGSVGPRDGTGAIADVVNQYFGDANPNHICLFASSNDAGNGGMYISGEASSASPLGGVLKTSYTQSGYNIYTDYVLDAWSRTPISGRLLCNVMVVNGSGSVLQSVTVTPTANGTPIDLGNYYGNLTAYSQTSGTGKRGVVIDADGGEDGYVYDRSGYYIAVQIYPSSGSCTIDAWTPSGYTSFDNSPGVDGCTWTKGSDRSSIDDEASIESAIAVGAYVSKNRVTDHNGNTYSLRSSYPNIGDIAYFSSYQEEGAGPTGRQIPWICAPGATIVSAVNHYHSIGTQDGGSYVDDSYADYGMFRVNNSTTNPYGNMDGTSMATPAAAGIVALWLQAANEAGTALTTSEVKTVMRETAIRDPYVTTGSNASHFGYGKIDALAGIGYILKNYATPGEVRYKADATAANWTALGPAADGSYTLNDGSYEAFEVTNDIANATVSYVRNFKGNVWSEWFVPFSHTITAEEASNNKFASLEGILTRGGKPVIGVAVMQPGDVLKANHAYVVKPASDGVQTFVSQGVTLSRTTTDVPVEVWSVSNKYVFTGVYSLKAGTSADNGWYALSPSTGSFEQAAASGTGVGPFRFYLTVTPREDNPYGTQPYSVALEIVEGATGITGITSVEAAKANAVYDLQGRRVAKPTAKGVYIVNGRKVVM